MYAEADDVWQSVEISGLHQKSVRVTAWMVEFPDVYDGVRITTKRCLVNTNRSQSNYRNEMRGHTVFFCFDNYAHVHNDYLRQQEKLDASSKSKIRVAEIPATGSTRVIDHGDYHVVALWYKPHKTSAHGVELKRLKVQTHLPSGPAYAHYSEKIAFEHLHRILCDTEYQVRKESIIVNFADAATMVDNKGVHCYNVDGKIRKRGSPINLGIEIKKNWDVFLSKKEENMFKLRMYEEELGAPCLLMLVEPHICMCKISETTTLKDFCPDVKRVVDAHFDAIDQANLERVAKRLCIRKQDPEQVTVDAA